MQIDSREPMRKILCPISAWLNFRKLPLYDVNDIALIDEKGRSRALTIAYTLLVAVSTAIEPIRLPTDSRWTHESGHESGMGPRQYSLGSWRPLFDSNVDSALWEGHEKRLSGFGRHGVASSEMVREDCRVMFAKAR